MKEERRRNYLKNAYKLFYDITVKGSYEYTFDLMDFSVHKMTMNKRLNLLRSGGNLLYRKLNPWSWPTHMQIELTNYCNLKCQVCPTGSGLLGRKPVAISVELFQRLLDEVGPYLLSASLFAWGEPLLHPQIAEILRLTQNRGLVISVSTNGQNLDEESVIQALVEYPPTYLIVAIDGLTDDTNSKFRVGARLAPALNGVRKLARIKRERGLIYPILHHRYIAMKHNEHELPLLEQFSKDNQFDLLTVRTLSVGNTLDERYSGLIPDNEKLRAYRYRENRRVKLDNFICERIFTYPTVFADGTVVLCCEDAKASQPCGKISDGASFAKVWWSERAAMIRKKIRENSKTYSFCVNCPFRDRPVTDSSIQRFELHNCVHT